MARATATLALLMVPGLLGSSIPLGVVVHGYHCSALHWEEVVWGDQASQKLGRLPHAVLIAWEGRDELVAFICGTGADPIAEAVASERKRLLQALVSSGSIRKKQRSG